jgi:hypothetical protein
LARVREDDTPDPATWHAPLLAALNTVLVEELGGVPVITAEQELGITRHLFRVALTARVGASDAAEHTVRTDPEIARALDRLAQPGTVP